MRYNSDKGEWSDIVVCRRLIIVDRIAGLERFYELSAILYFGKHYGAKNTHFLSSCRLFVRDSSSLMERIPFALDFSRFPLYLDERLFALFPSLFSFPPNRSNEYTLVCHPVVISYRSLRGLES